MNNPLVSIIIPVFNAEKYLKKCVESILAQTYSNVEIILVNDGSTDYSFVLCNELGQQYSKITVLHKTHEGVSEARNFGLSVAKGEFILFLDSDDYWSENVDCLKILMSQIISARNEMDFLLFNYELYYQKSNKKRKSILYSENAICGKNKNEKIINLIKSGLFPMSAWSKIIRALFLRENNISFIKGIIAEDIPWFIEMINKSNNFIISNEYLVVYRRQVPGSLTNTFSENKYLDLLNIVKTESAKLLAVETHTPFISALLSFMAYEYSILIGMTWKFKGKKYRGYLKELKKYKWLFKYDLNPKVRKVKLLYMLFGIHITSLLLRLYIRIT